MNKLLSALFTPPFSTASMAATAADVDQAMSKDAVKTEVTAVKAAVKSDEAKIAVDKAKESADKTKLAEEKTEAKK